MILFYLFITAVLIQLGFGLFLFSRIFNLKKEESGYGFIPRPVSIIICAKNEAKNLDDHLTGILRQKYGGDL